MNLNPNSKLVRWAYFFSSSMNTPGTYFGPRSTTLCAFFWRAFVIVPLVWLFIFGLVGAILWAIWQAPLVAATYVGVIVLYLVFLAILPIIFGEIARFVRKGSTISSSSTLGVAAAGVRSIKQKFCPIIRFENPNDTE